MPINDNSGGRVRPNGSSLTDFSYAPVRIHPTTILHHNHISLFSSEYPVYRVQTRRIAQCNYESPTNCVKGAIPDVREHSSDNKKEFCEKSVEEKQDTASVLVPEGIRTLYQLFPVEVAEALVRFSTVNTKAMECGEGEGVDFSDVYEYLGVSGVAIDTLRECCTKAYGVDCIRCGAEYFAPISCGNRYFCKRCRERSNKRQRGEVNDVFDAMYEGIRQIRKLGYGIRVKYMFDTFTLPKVLSLRVIGNGDMVNRFARVVRRSLNRFWGGQVGGFMVVHEWASRLIWNPHGHFHVIYPNVVRGSKKSGDRGFMVVPYFLSESDLDRYRRIYTEELNKEFDMSVEMADFDHKYVRSRIHLRHEINYTVRSVFDDFEKGFIELVKDISVNDNTGKIKKSGWVIWKNEYKGDKDCVYVIPVEVMRMILLFVTEMYRKRGRWFGFLGDSVKTKNLGLLNVLRYRVIDSVVCPKCGGELVLDRDRIYPAWDNERELLLSNKKYRWEYDILVGEK